MSTGSTDDTQVPGLPTRIPTAPSLGTQSCPVLGAGSHPTQDLGSPTAGLTRSPSGSSSEEPHSSQASPEGNCPLPFPPLPSRSVCAGPAMHACGITNDTCVWHCHACSLATCAPGRPLGSHLTGSPTALWEGSSPISRGSPKCSSGETGRFAQVTKLIQSEAGFESGLFDTKHTHFPSCSTSDTA